MKINCGPDQKTKHEIDCVKARREAARLKEWHNFFALIPRRVGNYDCRWLEMIERRFPNAEAFGSNVGRIHPDFAEYRAKK